MQLHFFREMVNLEKSKWSRVLPLVGFEGLEFESFLDYWINRPEQSLGIATQYCGPVVQLRPIFAVRPPRPVCIADFEIERCIGVGGFSKVYLGKCNFTGELCALKFISKEYIIRNGKQKLLFN
jgi:serum/glucocorticoid-regulated kinase 2